MEVLVKYFHKIMYCLEIHQVVVIYIDTNTKVKTSISAIDDFEIAKLKLNK